MANPDALRRGLAASDFAFLRSVSTKLARQTGATMQDTDVLRSAGDSLETWRSAYVTMGAREAWTLHGTGSAGISRPLPHPSQADGLQPLR